MTTSPELDNVWALPVLLALQGLDGEASLPTVEEAVKKLPSYQLSDLQWARAIKNKYVRDAGARLKEVGFVSGGRKWALTDLGRAYLEEHGDGPLNWPQIDPLDPHEAREILAPLETVEVTDYPGYAIPALRALARGPTTKKQFLAVMDTLEDLLAGDRRTLNKGELVYRDRASWCLSQLKAAGEIRNPTTGTWEITEAGRARLERETEGWRIDPFQATSKAKVRAEQVEQTTRLAPTAHVLIPATVWPTDAWAALARRFGGDILEAFVDRVRPDLGSSPELDSPLARNIILYGPPGTGKTFVAKAIAQALTGKAEPDTDGPWTIVQFHPSYSYEDFVQGLRPDLSQPQLRYEVRRGPFMQLCSAAENDPNQFFVLVVDEINRGDPARIFGELLYALEYRDEAVELALGGRLRIPQNLVVVGTMNSVDRSVALVDYALRRRFSFVRLEPDPGAIRRARATEADGGELAARTLANFNDWLKTRLDREHLLGHSFFMNPATSPLDKGALTRIWRSDVLPLLEEYFFGDSKALSEAEAAWRRAASEQLSEAGASQPNLETPDE